MLPALFALALIAAQEPALDRFTLDNGLKVTLRPLKGAKHTALVVLFDLGGDHDPKGKSGLAHLVEHLYVTAAAGKEPARTVDQYVARYPHGWNAQTGDRYTVVATVFEPAELERELTDAAARMGDLRPGDADLEREHPRLLAEVEIMFGGHPMLSTRNQARELVRPTPLGGRRGGMPEHVRAITLDDVKSHWQRYYKPRNAALVLAGNLDAASARKSVTSLFGALPAGDAAPAPFEPGKPVFEKAKLLDVKLGRGALGYASVAYTAPLPGSDLYAPFLMMASRIMSAVVELKGLGRFPLHYAVLDDPAVLCITVRVVQVDETPEHALDRVRLVVATAVAREFDARDSADRFDMFLGLRDATDPYAAAFFLGRRHQLGLDPVKMKAALDAVTANDIRRVAREVFAPERSAGVVVTPRDD